MSRLLSELLAGIAEVAVDADIAGLVLDSRAVARGDLFFALAGTQTQGHAFVADALARGAAAVVYDPAAGNPATGAPATSSRGVPLLPIPELRRHVGIVADRFFGAPSAALTVVGVTGTNGKTTCTQLLAQVLDTPAARCAVIGTVGVGFPGTLSPATHTTPDAIAVHRLLAEFHANGARYVCMEVSSHALAQDRVAGVRFKLAVFTNLTRDHLDYHGDMESYGAAKARLFAVPGLDAAAVNIDDDFGRALAARIKPRVVTYGLAQGDVHARDLRLSTDGLSLRLCTPTDEALLQTQLIGRFNASNLVAVTAALFALGMPVHEAAPRLARARPVSGRMERFGGGLQPLVLVDYAHTPDALEKVLHAAREHTPGQLWCVFGCGGDRDRGKRPLMGAIAERLADVVVVTDDNPRTEDPQRIVDDILAGMRTRPRVVRDRRAAIATAVGAARGGDTVVVAGKGHEDYQQIGTQKFPFSDQAAVRESLGVAA